VGQELDDFGIMRAKKILESHPPQNMHQKPIITA